MKRQKKSNNIFSKPILPQSLFYQEVQKQYKVGGVKIQGSWLKDTPAPIYRSSVKSALQISQLKGQITQIKKSTNQSSTDLFRMAQLQKKMDNFQLLATSPTKKMKNQDLKISVDNLTLQKVNSFWGIYQRKCKIIDKIMIVFSEKQKKQNRIDLTPYTIQLQERNSVNSQSSAFIWPQKLNFRLFLSGKQLRPYCVYGQQKVLKNMLKKIKIQAIQMVQIDFFKNVAKQYEQKILINFGNRLRVYQHMLKEKQKQNLQIAFDLIEKSHILDEAVQEGQKINQRGNNTNSLLQQSFQNSQSSHNKNNTTVNNNNKSVLNRSINFGNNSINLSPNLSPITGASKSPNQSQFRIKARRSTIHYQDLDDDDQANQRIQNFKLQIKQVAHSDSDEQIPQQNNQIQKDDSSKDMKKSQNKIMMQQLIIPEYMNEDSISQESAVFEKNKYNRYKPKKKDDNQSKFQLHQIQLTHYLYLAFFQDFCAYSDSNIQLTIYQTMIPQIQYQDMKIPVCTLQKIHLKRDQNIPSLFISQKPIIIKLSKKGQRIQLLFNNKVTQIKQQLNINLNKILYAIDQSQLLYIKVQNRIQCAGKLKIIVSPNKIQPKQYIQETTIQFLTKYIIKQQYKRQDKYKFIDYKKRNHQVCQLWNHKMMKRIINKADQQQFIKSIFFGFPPKIYDKIVNNLRNARSLTRSQTKMESNSSYFSTQCYSLLEQQIVRMKVYDLRVFIKIDKLFDLIVQSPKNLILQKRIDQVNTFLTLKYGKATVQKFMAVFVIQVLRKIQNLLLQLKNSRQIQAFIKQYFEVQYEIDNIMKSASSYFN